MARCPIFVHALATSVSSVYPLHQINDAESTLVFLDCQKSRCQMWNEKTNDCGLKSPDEVTLSLADKPEEPDEKDSPPVPLPKNR